MFLSDKYNCIDSVFSAKHRVLDINFALCPFFENVVGMKRSLVIFQHPKELHEICCTKRNQKETWACNVNNTVNYVSKLNIWLHKYIFQIFMIIEWKAHIYAELSGKCCFSSLEPFSILLIWKLIYWHLSGEFRTESISLFHFTQTVLNRSYSDQWTV